MSLGLLQLDYPLERKFHSDSLDAQGQLTADTVIRQFQAPSQVVWIRLKRTAIAERLKNP